MIMLKIVSTCIYTCLLFLKNAIMFEEPGILGAAPPPPTQPQVYGLFIHSDIAFQVYQGVC